MPDHLSVLKPVDDLIFLSESKCYSIFLHPGGEAARALQPFQLVLCNLCSIRYNTNQLISNNIYKDNRFFVCVYPMANFVLDLSTHRDACHQKLVCFVLFLHGNVV